MSNNAPTGVEFYYTLDGSEPTKQSNKYIGPFEIQKDATVHAMAMTVGTYTGNNYSYYYSSPVYSNGVDITAYSIPHEPQNLQIVDKKNNSFYISCEVGNSGYNNTAVGVEIYYTLDGSEPTLSSQCIKMQGSSGTKVETNILYVAKDTSIKAFARTLGSVDNYLYSNMSPTISGTILYYQTPIIYTPTITYDKKLIKKSTINIKQHVYLYKNSELMSCKIGLYKNNNNNELAIDEIPIDNIDTVNDDLKRENVELDIEYKYDLSKFEVRKNDEIYVKLIYDIQNGAGENIVNSENTPSSPMYLIESSGIIRVHIIQNNIDKWYEGQVWIKVGENWKEATDVFVNVNGNWKESV